MDNKTAKGIGIGLGILLGLVVITGVRADRRKNLEKIADTPKPEFQKINVIGNPDIPETFYNTPEGRAYLTIDGKPVDEYLRSR